MDFVSIIIPYYKKRKYIEFAIHSVIQQTYKNFDEICNMVNMKPTAVRVALSRARKTLREALIKKHNYGIR